jgi:hypothetical protein
LSSGSGRVRALRVLFALARLRDLDDLLEEVALLVRPFRET